jgi:hypothetical protein
MATAAEVNIETFSDQDFIKRFIYQSQGATDDLDPIDLTGSVLHLDVRRHASDVEAMIDLASSRAYTVENGGIIIENAEAGDFTVHLPYKQLRHMRPGVYAQSLIQVRPDGLRVAVWEGTLTHKAGPTR